MRLNLELTKQISAGKIKFDNNSEELRAQLLQENGGYLIAATLQKLILYLSQTVSSYIRISSIVRKPGGHHGERRAVDIGNEEIANEILPKIANDLQASIYNIDEIIYDAGGSLQVSRNKWNYDNGVRHNFSETVLSQHKNHIHFSVKS